MIIMSLWEEKKSAQTSTVSFKMCMLKIEQIHKMLSTTTSTDCYFMRCMPFQCSAWQSTLACLSPTLGANFILPYVIWALGMYEQSGFSSYSAPQNFKVSYQWAENPPCLCSWSSESDFVMWMTGHIQPNNVNKQATICAGFAKLISLICTYFHNDGWTAGKNARRIPYRWMDLEGFFF